MRVNFWVLLAEQADWIRAVKPAEPAVSMHRLLLVFCSVTLPEVGGGGGVGFTVRVAAVVVAVPAEFANTARYRLPFCDKVVVKLRVVEVAPETLLNVTPPSVLTCHCTVGVGEPVAVAVKVAVCPAVTVWFVGCVLIAGGVAFTVSVAAAVVAAPAEFVNTARYRFPFCDKAVVKLRVVEVAPETLLNVTPASVLTCHCTVGVGEPVAAAVKVAVWPAVTV